MFVSRVNRKDLFQVDEVFGQLGSIFLYRSSETQDFSTNNHEPLQEVIKIPFTLYTYFTHLLYTIHFFEHLNNCTSVLDGHQCIKQGISNLKYFQRPGRHTAHAKNIMLLSGNLALGTGVQGNVVTHQVGRHLPAGDLEFWRLILVLGCLKTDWWIVLNLAKRWKNRNWGEDSSASPGCLVTILHILSQTGPTINHPQTHVGNRNLPLVQLLQQRHGRFPGHCPCTAVEGSTSVGCTDSNCTQGHTPSEALKMASWVIEVYMYIHTCIMHHWLTYILCIKNITSPYYIFKKTCT